MPEPIRATGTFEVQFEPPPPNAEPKPIGRMSIDKVFSGDLEGTSRVEMLTAMTAVPGSAAYVAIEYFTGTLAGRNGSFFLHHTGISRGNDKTLTVTVVPDSGVGELLGLEGKLNIRMDGKTHCYDFDYTFG